jgi:hypothetical protein
LRFDKWYHTLVPLPYKWRRNCTMWFHSTNFIHLFHNEQFWKRAVIILIGQKTLSQKSYFRDHVHNFYGLLKMDVCWKWKRDFGFHSSTIGFWFSLKPTEIILNFEIWQLRTDSPPNEVRIRNNICNTNKISGLL